MDANSIKLYFQKNIEWVIHFLIWFFMISERWVNHAPQHNYMWLNGIYQTVLLIFTLILPIYINALVLIPKYLKKSQWIKYILALVSTLLVANIVRGFLTVLYLHFQHFEYNFYEEFLKWSFRDYLSLERFVFSPTSLILWLSFAYRFIKDWFMNEKIRSKLETEKAIMELNFLKSQISPHFLFNSLNSLYALALGEKAQLTADGLAKMGTLMRYTFHDSQVERISLNKEIDYIIKYIELQKIRLTGEKKAGIRVIIAIDESNNKQIAPMLLMPFIENAFKYGISLVEEIAIEVDISLSGDFLNMTLKNTVHNANVIEESGVGLKNVVNRLNLIYPNRYELDCRREEKFYIVHLKIKLE